MRLTLTFRLVAVTGQLQEMTIASKSDMGVVLRSATDREFFLPIAEISAAALEEGKVRVFVYRNTAGEQQVTTRFPKAQAGEFALLQMKATRGAGALMELEAPVDLLVPHEEQKRSMDEERWYVTYVGLDTATDSLFGSTRIEHYLSNEMLNVEQGAEVDLLVYARSELGLSVIVNDQHHGLVHHNEVFKPVSIGDRITGYVKRIRDDNKLDIVLQPIGYRQYIDVNTSLLAKRLETKGYLPLTDKSSAEEIHHEFGISKKAFKKALGALYKERLVRLGEDGIVWMG